MTEMDRRRFAVLDPGLHYLVAVIGREIAGHAYAGPYHHRAAFRYTIEDSIYVLPDRLRQGIGRILLSRLIEECGQRGFRQMVAVIGNSANYASIGLHERLGFRLAGTLYSVGFKFGRWVDSVLMQRELAQHGEPCLPA